MSGKKQKVVKSQSKYASHYVGELLDQLIANRLNTCRFPRGTEKWMRKMRSKVLQNVSRQSRSAFRKEPKPDDVRGEIDELLGKIELQRENISKLLEAERKGSTSALAQRPPSSKPAYVPGQFEESSNRIQQQFGQVAQLLQTLTQELEPRRSSMEDMLKQVQPVLLDLQKRPKTSSVSSATRGQTAPGPTATTSKKVTYGANAKEVNALQQVQRALGRK